MARPPSPSSPPATAGRGDSSRISENVRDEFSDATVQESDTHDQRSRCVGLGYFFTPCPMLYAISTTGLIYLKFSSKLEGTLMSAEIQFRG